MSNEKEKKSSNYEITPQTMAIIPIQNENGTTITRIMEEHVEYVVQKPPIKMIEYACSFFGSSLRGRLDGTRDICGITHKAPISINPTSGIYFFPTYSPANKKCSWISHSHIDRIMPATKQQTKIVFSNGKSLVVDVSFGSISNQMNRTSNFRFLLTKRLRELELAHPEMLRDEM